MRVSELYNLSRNQGELDFVDIRLDTDVPVFIDPAAIRSLQSPWGHELTSTMNSFFGQVLSLIKEGENESAQSLLSSLNETNEFHLGLSKKQSQGKAFGSSSATDVWSALSKKDGKVLDLIDKIEDTILLVEGIGKDMISDALCNILRRQFISYTQDVCSYYGIPMESNIVSGKYWNSHTKQWSEEFVKLPRDQNHGVFILVPKNIVRLRMNYDSSKYYQHFLLPEMQKYEASIGSSLVETRKDGSAFVAKKSLIEEYGRRKRDIVRETLNHPDAILKYKNAVEKSPSVPLGHKEMAKQLDIPTIDYEELLKELEACPTGAEAAKEYEDIIEKIFTALCYPFLCNPDKQTRINQGRKIIDLTYTNEANGGFFAWLAKHYPSALIMIECKNYGKDIGNPEVDQIIGRFSPSRGLFGIIVCREIENRERLVERCKDAVHSNQGYIVCIDDSDVKLLIQERLREDNPNSYEDQTIEDGTAGKFTILKELFDRLIKNS